MATTVILQKRRGKLAPLGPLDAELVDGLPEADFKAVLTRAKDTRSVEQNNLRWKVCELIAENTDGWTKEEVHDALKIATGHVSYRQAPDGTLWRFAKSTAFDAMGSAEFSAWLDLAFAKAEELFGPGLPEAVQTELHDLISGVTARSEAA
jgi:hypothetical protein